MWLSLLAKIGILGILLEARILMLMAFLMILLWRLLVDLVPVVGFLMPLMPTLSIINVLA